MNDYLNNPVFQIYTISCLVLCLNLLFLWGYSGAVRAKVMKTPNEEDVSQFGGALAEIDPPPIARVLRAHRNAQANIYPFLLLGLVFVLMGGTRAHALILFGTFTVARLVHSFVYLKAMQPWRTVFFTIGGLATIALMLDIVWLMFH
jgi:prostaglandin-E synthase 1